MPVGVEVHAQVHSMLAQEAQVLARARPAEHAERLLLRGRYDDVDAAHLAISGAEVAKQVVMPAWNQVILMRTQPPAQQMFMSGQPASESSSKGIPPAI